MCGSASSCRRSRRLPADGANSSQAGRAARYPCVSPGLRDKPCGRPLAPYAAGVTQPGPPTEGTAVTDDEHRPVSIPAPAPAGDNRVPAALADELELLRRLGDVGQKLLEGLTVDGVVRTVVEQGLSLLGAVAGGVWQRDGD